MATAWIFVHSLVHSLILDIFIEYMSQEYITILWTDLKKGWIFLFQTHLKYLYSQEY